MLFFSVVKEALDYFLSLQSDSHREAWSSLLLLVMTKILKMNEERFRAHVKVLYPLLCDTIMYDLKPELRSILRKFFLRIGPSFGIVPK